MRRGTGVLVKPRFVIKIQFPDGEWKRARMAGMPVKKQDFTDSPFHMPYQSDRAAAYDIAVMINAFGIDTRVEQVKD